MTVHTHTLVCTLWTTGKEYRELHTRLRRGRGRVHGTAVLVLIRGAHVLVGVLLGPLRLMHLVLAPGPQVVHATRL